MAKQKKIGSKNPVVRYESNPKPRKELLKIYDIKGSVGRGQLVMDSESLDTIQRAVLHVLAIRSGGKGVNNDPELSYVNNRTVAGGARISLSKLGEVWNELDNHPVLGKLIRRWSTPGNKRTYTRVFWKN